MVRWVFLCLLLVAQWAQMSSANELQEDASPVPVPAPPPPIIGGPVPVVNAGPPGNIPGQDTFSDYLGVTFTPYTGKYKGTPPNATVPSFASYTVQDVQRMVAVFEPYFDVFTTLSAGWTLNYPPNTPWNQVDSECHTATAAAQNNKFRRSTEVQLIQGAYQQPNTQYDALEINGAFSSIDNANSIWPNTVIGLNIFDQYCNSPSSCNYTYNVLLQNRANTTGRSLLLGIGTTLSRSSCLAIANPDSPIYEYVGRIFEVSDFIICSILPSVDNVVAGAREVQSLYDDINNAAQQFTEIELILQTGWPHAGVTDSGITASNFNAQSYLNSMYLWANENEHDVAWFEAFDQPWLCDQNDVENTGASGPNGANCNYGIWREVIKNVYALNYNIP